MNAFRYFWKSMNDANGSAYPFKNAKVCWDTMHKVERDEWVASYDAHLLDRAKHR